MTGGPFDPAHRRGYHHGNLREALVAAALRLIGEKGPAGFTVAEAARAAGVSPAAPYRHFRDRDELMADIAAQGYVRFAARLAAAGGAVKDPKEALLAIGTAYLAFAREEPAAFTAMFESGLVFSDWPELHARAEAAFDVLRAAAARYLATFPEGRRPPELMVALHLWTLAHGTASLFARAGGSRRPIPMAPEDLLEAGGRVYLDGLAAPLSKL